MSPVWTRDQQRAISLRDTNVLVTASAGTGKTAVLVERIIHLLTADDRPVDIDRLLVVTFTSAAAAEIRARIGQALTDSLADRPSDRRLLRQLALLERASITTLHSFCLELVRQHFHLVGVDAFFRVGGEHECTLLQQDVIDDMLENFYLSADEDFLNLAEAFGGDRGDFGLQRLILDLHRHASTHPEPDRWLESTAACFTNPSGSLDTFPWANELKLHTVRCLDAAISEYCEALRLASQPGGPVVYLEALTKDVNGLKALRASAYGLWDDIYQSFIHFGFARLPTCRSSDVDLQLKDKVKSIRDRAKSLVARVQRNYFGRPSNDLVADLRLAAPFVSALVRAVRAFDEAYTRLKRQRNILDFADLEHLALRLLSVDDLRVEICDRYAEVLVDEYQDINEVQERILRAVSQPKGRSGNLFMVGDVKQSIYRFRLAEPALFLEKLKAFQASPGGGGEVVHLTDNFRCRRGIIDAVNFIFRQVMTPGVGEICYDRSAELLCKADYPILGNGEPSLEPQLHILTPVQAMTAEPTDVEDSADAGEDTEEFEAPEMEARLAATAINKLIQARTPVYDKGAKASRPVRYRDCVVLMRAVAGWAPTFLEVFREEGIPCYAELGTGYLGATEVDTVLSLLSVIDNPRQDIPLAGVLRSPIVGLNAEDLAGIRLVGGKGEFFDAVCIAANDSSYSKSPLLKEFLSSLDTWRTMARRSGVADLVWAVLEQTGYYDFVGGLPGGAQRQANLRALHDRAREYEATAFRGLFRFLRFIDRLRENGGDMGTARPLGEDEDVVRVMSIHRAKGLEFPIVIIAGLGKPFNRQDLYRPVLIHRKLGLGPPVVDLTSRCSYPTIAAHAIRFRLESEALAEELRTLYVGLTRARERLTLIATAPSLRKSIARWSTVVHHPEVQLPDSVLAAVRSPLDWLVLALLRHSDGTVLRNMLSNEPSLPVSVLTDQSRWNIQIHYGQPPAYSGVPLNDREPVAGNDDFASAQALKNEVRRRLSWTYPWATAKPLAGKIAVTQVKRLVNSSSSAADSLASPAGPQELTAYQAIGKSSSSLTPAEIGVATHLVLRHIDLQHRLDREGIRQQIETMLEQDKLGVLEAAAVDCSALAAFFSSPLGVRLQRASRVFRELPFTLACKASEVYSDVPPPLVDETVILQGVLDCLFEEQDGLVLIDYKTDRVTSGMDDEVCRRYSGQLALYAHAAQTILRRPVKERYLYLFSTGRSLLCG